LLFSMGVLGIYRVNISLCTAAIIDFEAYP
jgi:hypothetical protein